MRSIRLQVPLAVSLLVLTACSSPSPPPAPTLDPVPAIDPLHVSPVEFPVTWRYRESAIPAAGARGMVVSTDSLASAAGLEILRAGGNAVDAAIAVQFALAVVHPIAGNIGGGGFLVARMADDRRVALDFREKAPGAASKNMYLDAHGNVTQDSWVGHRAAGVPGTVAGMMAAHERFGTLPWDRLLEPAIELAADGFRIQARHHADLSWGRDRLSRFPATAETFLAYGKAPAVGAPFRQPDLGRTLQAISDHGPAGFYDGWVADSIVAEMERGGGLITREDLSAYEAVWRTPIEIDYRGWTVISMPPPSSGGITMGQILNILESWRLGSMGWHSPQAIHLAVEAMRRAYADRNFYLGDPDQVQMPVQHLTSQVYADSLASTIDMGRASSSEEFNRVPVESPETTHFSIVDEWGNAVAVTTTLNGGFGSGVVVRGAGFLLNNEMDDFTSKPGVPNAYGLVQGEANAIAPGKRMLSAMTPTVVLNPAGRTELITGTPGGSTIITTIFQIVSNHIDFGLPVRSSVDAPRFHHQNLPDEIRFEYGGLLPETVEMLREMGHEVRERDGISGDVESIWIAPDGTRYGAADRRRDGAALGY